MEYVRDDRMVEFSYEGEGRNGDFDPNDPNDVALLRFTVWDRDGDDWEPMTDGSYCTLLPKGTDDGIVNAAARLVMDTLEVANSPKRACEQLSQVIHIDRFRL